MDSIASLCSRCPFHACAAPLPELLHAVAHKLTSMAERTISYMLESAHRHNVISSELVPSSSAHRLLTEGPDLDDHIEMNGIQRSTAENTARSLDTLTIPPSPHVSFASLEAWLEAWRSRLGSVSAK